MLVAFINYEKHEHLHFAFDRQTKQKLDIENITRNVDVNNCMLKKNSVHIFNTC